MPQLHRSWRVVNADPEGHMVSQGYPKWTALVARLSDELGGRAPGLLVCDDVFCTVCCPTEKLRVANCSEVPRHDPRGVAAS